MDGEAAADKVRAITHQLDSEALIIAACGGLLAGLFYWLASRHYPADVDRVRGALLEMEG